MPSQTLETPTQTPSPKSVRKAICYELLRNSCSLMINSIINKVLEMMQVELIENNKSLSVSDKTRLSSPIIDIKQEFDLYYINNTIDLGPKRELLMVFFEGIPEPLNTGLNLEQINIIKRHIELLLNLQFELQCCFGTLQNNTHVPKTEIDYAYTKMDLLQKHMEEHHLLNGNTIHLQYQLMLFHVNVC
jgi:hypothetical protein